MVNSETLTIMFLDIVEYTKNTSKFNREELNLLHELFDSLCLPNFQNYNGNVIKKVGDAFIVTFKSATDSLFCAVKLQESFREFNKKFKKFPIQIRIAIHTGEVLWRQNDIYGRNVNITSRIEGITKPGDIVFSETLLFNINKKEINYRYIGAHKLKGIENPVKLFRVVQKHESRISIGTILRKLFVILILAVLATLVYYVLKH
jgi:class 3 adenylate cyclase